MGIRTTNLDSISLADEVIVNRDGSTGRQTVTSLGQQMIASGPVAERIAQVEASILSPSEIAALGERVGVLEDTGATLEDTDALGDRLAALEAEGVVGYQFAPGGPAAVATTEDITLSGEQTIDGIVTSGSRVLVKDQAAPEENGVYVTGSGSWTRAADMDIAAEVQATAVFVSGGTVGGGKTYITYSIVATLGTDPIAFVEGPDSDATLAQIAAFEANLTNVTEAVSVSEYIGHPDVPAVTGGSTASPANFVLGVPVERSGTVRRATLFADNAGTIEFSTWLVSGDEKTKIDRAAISVSAGLQTVEINVPVEAGEYLGFCSSGVSIVSYKAGEADPVGWWAGGVYGSTSFSDSTLTTTSRLYIQFEVWSVGERGLKAIDDDLTDLTGRVDELDRPYPIGNSGNLANALSDQIALNTYMIPATGTAGPITGDRYAVIGAFPVVAGQRYRLDITEAPGEWRIYTHPTASLFFSSAEPLTAANSVARILPGTNDYALSNNNRTAVFTAPAGATHVAATVFGFSRSVTQAEFERMRGAVSLVEDWDEVPLEAQARAERTHDVAVERAGDFFYVRMPFRPGEDAVWRVNADYDPGANTNGAVDFDGIRLIRSATLYENTAAAWTASAVIINGGGDATPPHNMNSMFIGGGHGPVSQQVTAAVHGKTNVDVGSTYTDAASKVWILTKVVDENTLVYTAANTGTATSWVISGAITGDLTHTAGGTNTATVSPSATVSTQLWPSIQNYRVRALIDGVVIMEDGIFVGDRFQIVEEYGIPNVASLLDALEADVGNDADPDYTRADVQTQVEVQTTYAWDFSGACEVVMTTFDVQAYTVGYHGGMQMQKMIADASETLYLHVPRCTTGTLADGEDTAGFSATVDVVAADWTDPTNPPDRFFQILRRGTERRRGFIQGYSRNAGVDRTDLNSAFYTPHTSLKMYPRAVDPGMGATAVAGTLREIVGFFGPMDNLADQDFDAKVLFPDAGAHSLYLCAPGALSSKWVSLPKRLIGKPVTMSLTNGITCASTVVSSRGVLVTSAAGGELEIRIG